MTLRKVGYQAHQNLGILGVDSYVLRPSDADSELKILKFLSPCHILHPNQTKPNRFEKIHPYNDSSLRFDGGKHKKISLVVIHLATQGVFLFVHLTQC
jgi:hypothetical protein